MTTIVLVQCGSKKAGSRAPAKALYTGSLFRMGRRTAERIGTRWYILSAKHGLLTPEETVEPYDKKLPAKGDYVWGLRVLKTLRECEPKLDKARVVVLAAEAYCVGWAEKVKVERPLVGLGLGKRMRRMKELT